MPLVRFTVTPKLPRDLKYLGYEAGTEVDMTNDQANRWLRRGVAEIVPPPPIAPAAPPQIKSPVMPTGPTGASHTLALGTGATG